jgi:predicted protein tyrosine phosphatase
LDEKRFERTSEAEHKIQISGKKEPVHRKCPNCGNETVRWNPYYIKQCGNCEREGCVCIRVRTYIYLDNKWIPFTEARDRARKDKSINLKELDRKKLCFDCYKAWRKFGSLEVGKFEQAKEEGRVLNILFVCEDNSVRSQTAEKVFRNYERIEVNSAGITEEALNHISEEMIGWADLIFVMEEEQKRAVLRVSPSNESKIVVLDIPDVFREDDPELRDLLKKRVVPYIENLRIEN